MNNNLTNENELIVFFENVINDIKIKQCTEEQIKAICIFYNHYKMENHLNGINETKNDKNSKLNFSPSIFDYLTAGLTFYSSINNKTLEVENE